MDFESLALREGTIGRRDGSPQAPIRLPMGLAGPTEVGVYVVCVLSGDVRVTPMRRVHTASESQLAVLYEACVALLAAEESRLEKVAGLKPGATRGNLLLRNVLAYTDRNICDPVLSPAAVACAFGISVRYLHKLFATFGVTFRTYVVMRRLDQVHNALASRDASSRTIAELARQWGFRDLSAFNRAFRKRFGCAPRRLRSRAAA